ncbi:MAG: DnaA ATPase domain-containing protein [Phycisphaerales bacterium]
MDASHAALSVRSGAGHDAGATWKPRLTTDVDGNDKDDGAPIAPQQGQSAEARITARVAAQIGSAQFDRFFSGGRSIRLTPGELEVDAPSTFVAGLLDRRFRAMLSDIATTETGRNDLPVRFVVAGELSGMVASSTLSPSAHASSAQSPQSNRPKRAPTRTGMPSARFRLEDFVTGPGCAFALDGVRRLIAPPRETAPHGNGRAGKPGTETRRREASILTVFGPCGVGKTHLLHGAAAAQLDADPATVVRVTTAEGFVGDFVAAIRSARAGAGARPARPEGFRRENRGADLLCIDDLAALEGKSATQTELLHTIDAIVARGGRVFVTLPEHPRRMKGLSEALVSRLLGGMVAGIDAPDANHRRALATAIAAQHGIELDDAAAAYVAELAAPARSPGEHTLPAANGAHTRTLRPGVREIEGLIIRVEAVRRLLGELGAAPSHGRVGVVGVQRALEAAGVPLITPGPRSAGVPVGGVAPPVRIEAIVEAVCTRTGVSAAEIMGSGRRPEVVAARSLAGFVARAVTKLSFPEIAAGLGRPNHSTVITACRRIATSLADGGRVPLAGGRGESLISDLVREVRSAVGA